MKEHFDPLSGLSAPADGARRTQPEWAALSARLAAAQDLRGVLAPRSSRTAATFGGGAAAFLADRRDSSSAGLADQSKREINSDALGAGKAVDGRNVQVADGATDDTESNA